MEDSSALFSTLVDIALEAGADNAAVIPAERIVTDELFRKLCEDNVCGNYGKCWMCPPDAGEIHELMARVKSFRYALVYQSIGQLEDSYDFEGMAEAGARHGRLVMQVRDATAAMGFPRLMNLGAGGCPVCAVCAKKTGEPCRFPDKALSSLETCGINVSELAKAAGMKYINGQNTVTYFGAALFDI